MSARIMLVGMIGVSIVAVVRASRPRAASPEPAPQPAAERPWLSREAEAQVIDVTGGLGPLFEGMEPGDPAPSPEGRARIVAFEKAHDVDIDVELDGDYIAAVRFAVSYGGCCGYEGADALARRLGRPKQAQGCGVPPELLNDWAASLEDGTRIRVNVDIDRVRVRWERELSIAETLARADAVLGRDANAVVRAAGDRWMPIKRSPWVDFNGAFLLEVPFGFNRDEYGLAATWPEVLGFNVAIDAGRIAEVAFLVREEHVDALTARWGRPARRGDVLAWRQPGRTIRATRDDRWITVRLAAI